MNPTLTILTYTVDGQDKLKRILPGFREVADQIVVGIDDATTDESVAVARQYADEVVSVPHGCFHDYGKPYHVHAYEFAFPHCRGDWILRLDHDETLGPGWQDKARVSEILSDRYATHYRIPRRWVVEPGDRFISNKHWYPDHQLRLFRNIPSILQLEPELVLHGSTGVLGEPRCLVDEWILHWDLLWHSRQAREDKVRLYEDFGPYTAREFYLHEGQEYETKPVDYQLPKRQSGTAAELSSSPVTCEIQILDVPEILYAGQITYILLNIRNLSQRVFRPASHGVYGANVRVSYHWLREPIGAGTVHAWDHSRTDLPCRLGPNESTTMYLRISEFPGPGIYWLQPDLVEEGVAWASSFCDLPCHRVEIR